ncbi:DUF6819 domain-containing protein [Cyclobacterium qasimii]|uniref:DUF6819 domain-containing protein n=1 Tax=Cyclobacterium qasimii M12-11B TaxID=641524 RepID=S7WNA5_9BACT|nr:DUF4954 family protein [Cyclobacterium qasimii]EPR68194.1 hypothetical protein ADICYQ_2914 [Cyclobacterium qasimii M12-11B]
MLSSKDPLVKELDIFATGWENSKRKIRLIKVAEAYTLFKQLIQYYPVYCLSEYYSKVDLSNESFLKELTSKLPAPDMWINVGGQLVPKLCMDQLIADVKEGEINSWNDLHDRYIKLGNEYEEAKTKHAFAIAFADQGIETSDFDKSQLFEMLEASKSFRQAMSEKIYSSRKKDYDNPFRNMVYANEEERDLVLGALEDNGFIQTEKEESQKFIQQINDFQNSLNI